MSLNTWIRSVEGDQRRRLGKSRRSVRPVQLDVEWLEARTLLSPGSGSPGLPPLPVPPPISLVDSWTNPLGGDWNNYLNWSLLRPPIATDIVVIDLGVALTVTYSALLTGYFSSLTLGLTATLDLSGGSLIGKTFTNNGTFTLEAGTSATIGNSFTNTGTVNILAGADLSATSYSQISGATNLANGALDSPNAIDLQGGTLSGPGIINADVANAGEISPGAAGTLVINGNYTQTATGILDIGLGGTNPGVDFDQVAISGIASFDGVLNVSYLNGFAPNDGQSFQVMQFSSSSGAFAVVNGLDPMNGTMLTAQYNPQDLTLVAQSIVPGNPPPVSPNPPPVLSGPPPASQPANNTTPTPIGTTFLPPNSQTYSGFLGQNQAYHGSGGSNGYALVGGFSESSSGKHSENVAFLGGSGDDDQEMMLAFPVQLTMTSDDEALSTSDVAAVLLIGVRPRLLPQKGSHVAPVATLLADDSGEEIKPVTRTEEESPLRDSLISPLGQLHISSFQSSPQRRLYEELAAMGFDKEDKGQSSKSFFGLSPLAVVAGGLVALWGFRNIGAPRENKIDKNQ